MTTAVRRAAAVKTNLAPILCSLFFQILFILVMYTLYNSVSKSLPTTSYMKAAEWWLLYHTVAPVIIFAALFLDEHKKIILEKCKQRIPGSFNTIIEYFVFFGKGILPFVTIMFVIVFSLTVFIHYE